MEDVIEIGTVIVIAIGVDTTDVISVSPAEDFVNPGVADEEMIVGSIVLIEGEETNGRTSVLDAAGHAPLTVIEVGDPSQSQDSSGSQSQSQSQSRNRNRNRGSKSRS